MPSTETAATTTIRTESTAAGKKLPAELKEHISGYFGKRYKSGRFWYQLTSKAAAKDDDFSKVCQEEFGRDSSVVDWSRDLRSLHDRGEIPSLVAALEIDQPTFNESFFLVTEGGRDFYSGGRKYFFENHGGNPPGNWLVHSQLGDISLGSWYVGGRILCKYPEDCLGMVLGKTLES